MTTAPILRNAIGLTMVLQHAHDGGLPMPDYVRLGRDWLSISVPTLDDLTEWAVYLDVMIVERVLSTGDTQHSVTGEALEQPLEVWCITPALVAEVSA